MTHCDPVDPALLSTSLNLPWIEKEHVQKIYDSIARHWSETRYKPWPCVENFIRNLPEFSIIGDFGCGNGKYSKVMGSRPCFGVDFSIELLNMADQEFRSSEFVGGDCLNLPFRDQTFDHGLCVAVLHHLSSSERRIHLLREIARVLRPKGQCLVYAWAYEEKAHKEGARHKVVSQDSFIPWVWRERHVREDLGVWQRYCHLFREGEMDQLVEQVPELCVIQSYFDHENWCLILEKKIP